MRSVVSLLLAASLPGCSLLFTETGTGADDSGGDATTAQIDAGNTGCAASLLDNGSFDADLSPWTFGQDTSATLIPGRSGSALRLCLLEASRAPGLLEARSPVVVASRPSSMTLTGWVRSNRVGGAEDLFVLEQDGKQLDWGIGVELDVSQDWRQFSAAFPTDLATPQLYTLAVFVHDAAATTCIDLDDFCLTD